MLPCVRVKEGVQFKMGAPGGFVILGAFLHAAQAIAHDITITSGADGTHSGPEDPHFKGEAYDCRIHDLPDPQLALKAMQDFAGDRFFFWIEDAGQDNAHIHGQVKKGTIYPPAAPSSHDSVQEASAT